MLDYRLDGKDCLRVAKEIRTDCPMLPMIAISCSVTIAESYADYGFNGFLAKPFQLDRLYTLLRSLIV
jgi:CheY-like chemotaxis protein